MIDLTHLKVDKDVYISAENLVTWLSDKQADAHARCLEPTEYVGVSAYWRGSIATLSSAKDYIVEITGVDYE